MFKQNAVINSYNVNIYNQVNNDITLCFNPELFRKKPHKLDLIYFNADCRATLCGNTNNTILVTIIDEFNISTTYVIAVECCHMVMTDQDLADEITRALNNQIYNNYNIEFLCFAMNYENIITNAHIEQEDYTATFTILASNYCTLSFNHKDSIGPLIGFGYGIYDDLTPILGITGIHVPSMITYNYIQSYNNSGYTQFNLPNPLPDPIPNPNLLDYVCDDIVDISHHECCSHHNGSHHGPHNPGSHKCCSHKGGSHHSHSWKSWHKCGKNSNHSVESNHEGKKQKYGKKKKIIPPHVHVPSNPNCGYWKYHMGSHEHCSHYKGSKKGSHHRPTSHHHCSHYGGSHHSHKWKGLNGSSHAGSHKHCSCYTGSERGSHHGPNNPGSHHCCSHYCGSHHGPAVIPGHKHCSHYGGSHHTHRSWTGPHGSHHAHSHKCCSHNGGSTHQVPIDKHKCCSHKGGSHHTHKSWTGPHGSHHAHSHKCCSHNGGSHHGPVNPGSHHCCSHHGGSHHGPLSHKHCSHYGGASRGSHHGHHRRGSRKKKKHHDKHAGKKYFKQKKHKRTNYYTHQHVPWGEVPTNDADCCFTCLNRDTGTGPGNPIDDPNGGGCAVPMEPIYINYEDKNCKMLLYDSNNNLIPHHTHPGLDTTISLNNRISYPVFYNKIYKLLRDLEIELNRYITKFRPYAFFEVSYDYKKNEITITNKTGAKFGIGFDFLHDANFITTGSLHKVLGFEQRCYLGVTTITSTKTPLIYEYVFGEDYIFMMSDDLIADLNTDINVMPVGNGHHIPINDILYSIPMSKSHCFKPYDDNDFSVELFQSKFTYYDNCHEQENETEPICVNFYIRLKSGRHCQLITPWSSQLNIEYE